MKNLVEYIDESLLDDEEDLVNDQWAEQTMWLWDNIKKADKELGWATNPKEFKLVKSGNILEIVPVDPKYLDTMPIWLPDGKWPKGISVGESVQGVYIMTAKTKIDLSELNCRKINDISIDSKVAKSIDMSKCKIDIVKNFSVYCKNLESIDLSGIDSTHWLFLADCRKLKIDGLKLPHLSKYTKLPRELNDEFKKQLVKGTAIDPNSISFG